MLMAPKLETSKKIKMTSLYTFEVKDEFKDSWTEEDNHNMETYFQKLKETETNDCMMDDDI